MTRVSRRIAVALAALVALAACGDDDPAPRARPRPPSPARTVTPSPSPLASPTSALPPTPAASPTPSPSGPCPNEDVAARDVALRRPRVVDGDVDGDGAQDRAAVAVDEDGPAGCRAFVVVEANGELFSRPVAVDDGALVAGFPAPRSLAEVDALPGLDVVVDVAAGASTQFAAVFSLGGDDLVQVAVEGDEPATDDLFAFGGSVGHLDGVDCTEEGFVAVTSAVAQRRSYRVRRTFYAPGAATLVPQRALTETATVDVGDLSAFPELAVEPFASCR